VRRENDVNEWCSGAVNIESEERTTSTSGKDSEREEGTILSEQRGDSEREERRTLSERGKRAEQWTLSQKNERKGL
jgi:hypothetical protein